jgi:hypothetical protein
MGVLVAHLSVLVIVDKIRHPQKPAPKPVEPTFSTSTTTVSAPDGKLLKVVHEFTVQTAMAEKTVLEKLPKPPDADVAAPDAERAPAATR